MYHENVIGSSQSLTKPHGLITFKSKFYSMQLGENYISRDAVPFLEDGEPVVTQNPHINPTEDVLGLYHFHSDTELAKERFGHVNRVLMGGSADRAKRLAMELHDQLGLDIIEFTVRPSIRESIKNADLSDVRRWAGSKIKKACGVPAEIAGTERYSFYMVGDTIVVNHGMGLGSIEILVDELTKLLAAAEATNVKFIRIGTSGGYGVDPGTVVITDRAWSDRPKEDKAFEDATGKQGWPKSVCGEQEWWPAMADPDFIGFLIDAANAIGAPVQVGGTMSKSTFNGAEARMDGAICDISHEQAEEFFRYCISLGILNSEMEAGELFAACGRVGIRAAVICVVLDNCMTHESITLTDSQKKDFSGRAEAIVIKYIADESGITPQKVDKSWRRRLVQSFLMKMKV
jgi:uridine phosphorylase